MCFCNFLLSDQTCSLHQKISCTTEETRNCLEIFVLITCLHQQPSKLLQNYQLTFQFLANLVNIHLFERSLEQFEIVDVFMLLFWIEFNSFELDYSCKLKRWLMVLRHFPQSSHRGRACPWAGSRRRPTRAPQSCPSATEGCHWPRPASRAWDSIEIYFIFYSKESTQFVVNTGIVNSIIEV